MFPEFKLEPDSPPDPGRQLTPEEEKRLEIMWSRRVSPEERLGLENLLLDRLKQHKTELEEMLNIMGGHWAYEDHFYRYYHVSWKVYGTQTTTENAVSLLRRLLPERQ